MIGQPEVRSLLVMESCILLPLIWTMLQLCNTRLSRTRIAHPKKIMDYINFSFALYWWFYKFWSWNFESILYENMSNTLSLNYHFSPQSISKYVTLYVSSYRVAPAKSGINAKCVKTRLIKRCLPGKITYCWKWITFDDQFMAVTICQWNIDSHSMTCQWGRNHLLELDKAKIHRGCTSQSTTRPMSFLCC